MNKLVPDQHALEAAARERCETRAGFWDRCWPSERAELCAEVEPILAAGYAADHGLQALVAERDRLQQDLEVATTIGHRWMSETDALRDERDRLNRMVEALKQERGLRHIQKLAAQVRALRVALDNHTGEWCTCRYCEKAKRLLKDYL